MVLWRGERYGGSHHSDGLHCNAMPFKLGGKEYSYHRLGNFVYLLWNGQ